MGKIGIIRHGETEWNRLTKLQGREDIQLNQRGVDQARLVGEYLQNEEWNAVFTSPLLRAKETAQIISAIIGIDEIIVEDDFIERDYGSGSGLTLKERQAKFPNREYEGLEDWSLVRDRMLNSVIRLAEEHKHSNFLIVSHGGAINSLLYSLSDGQYGSGITKLYMGSISMLNFKEKTLTVDYYNKKVY